MWVRNETSDDTKDCEWVYLHVCCDWPDKFFVHGNECVIFLINIQIFDDAFS